MKHPAIIDLGTNTFHLLIGDENSNILHRKRVHVLLGKDRGTDNAISATAFDRAINAITEFSFIIKENDASPVIAVATEGFRSSSNSKMLMQEIFNRTGIKVEIISGDMEAELIYLGVRQTVSLLNKTALIMDVGGGSVEFIIANEGGVIQKFSFSTGAAYLLQMIAPSDPISTEEIKKTRDYLGKVFEPLFAAMNNHQPELLIGSSGSFESFAEIIAARDRQTELLDATQSTEIPFDDFKKVYQLIIGSSRRDRLLIPGLLEMRVDMIVLASIMIQLILENANFNRILMSKYALKEGLLWSHFNKQTT